MKKYILCTITLLFFLSNNAYAYLDPGSGSIILQAILGFIAATLATASFYWTKIKIFFSKLLKRKKKSESERY
tara:strand:- start:230 stop:448 length:219 start_codon:yes stop_codon:yes gene_type:complete